MVAAHKIEELAKRMGSELVGWRRRLHENPEPSFEEQETSRFVYETLESFGGLELSRPTPTSVIGCLRVGREGESGEKDASRGRTVALRADMDALPITEETELPYASKREGVMHACGHDGHTAILLGAAKALCAMKEEIPQPGEVRFVFQHAEETPPGGAEELVEKGVMEGVDAVVGLHLSSGIEVGKVGVAYGSAQAAPDAFEIVVEGGGGHGALPHKAVDPVAVAAQVVTNLQHVVARKTDPLEAVVVSVTRIAGGTAYNIIPESVELEGTVRTLDEEVRSKMPDLMQRIVEGVCEAHGASCSFEYRHGYRPVVNDEGVTRVIEEVARKLFGEGCVEQRRPTMAGEDFSAYQRVTPGAFFYLGSRNEEKGITYPHHHPRFDIDEGALGNGVKMFVHAALRLLDGPRPL